MRAEAEMVATAQAEANMTAFDALVSAVYPRLPPTSTLRCNEGLGLWAGNDYITHNFKMKTHWTKEAGET